jgi:CRP-like cAMP-binding protein
MSAHPHQMSGETAHYRAVNRIRSLPGQFSYSLFRMIEMDRVGRAVQADEPVCRLLCAVFGCSEDLADQILVRGRLRRFDSRTTILRRGDRVTTLFVVIAGRAHAIAYSLDGQAVLLHEYGSGDFFGVVSPPYSATHDADVVAIEELSTFLLEGGVLAILAEQHGCISLALLKVMVERLQQTASRMYEHAACPRSARPCRIACARPGSVRTSPSRPARSCPSSPAGLDDAGDGLAGA